jgi:hypothetical protein
VPAGREVVVEVDLVGAGREALERHPEGDDAALRIA